MKIKKECILCGKKRFRIIKKIKNHKIYECTNCTLAFTVYGEKNKRNYSYRKKETYDLQQYQLQEKKQSKKFKEIALIIRNFVRQGKVLEVGAGYGLFASLLAEKKYKLNVIEPHLKLIYLDRLKDKVKINKQSYEQFLKKNKERFDLVTFIDVLEHFNNPDLILKKTRSLLLDQGIVVILAPNHLSLMRVISKNWSLWRIEDHKYHFSVRSMKQLLKKNNFKIKYSATFENWHDMKKNLEDHFVPIKATWKRRLAKAIFFLIFMPFYFVLRRLVWRVGFGSELCIVASKT